MRVSSVVKLFLFGLLIRLLLMPWAMHSDLLSMYFRAHLMAEHGIWGLGVNQYIGHFIYALNLVVLKAVDWNLESFFLHDYGVSAGSLTASVGDWLRFMEHPQINSFLFWLKLPHLLVDIGVFVALAKLFKKHTHRLLILASWWANPINLYAFYIFSRHDVFTAAAVLAVVVFAAQNRVIPTLLTLFVAIQIRVQPLLLAPVFLVQLWQQRKNYKSLLAKTALALVAIFAYLGILRMLPVTGPALQELSQNIPTISTPSAIGIPTRHATQAFGTTFFGIPIFLSLYAVIGLWWVLQKGQSKAKYKTRFVELVKVTTTVMALYFAINPFSPHYFVWLSILLTLAVSVSPKILKWYALAVVGWVGLGIFSSDVTWFSQNLFAPVSTAVFRTPQINQILLPRFAAVGIEQSILLLLSRLILAGGLFALIWELYQEKLQPLLKKLPHLIGIGSLLLLLNATAPQAQAISVPAYQQPDATQQHDITNQPFRQTFTSSVDQFGSIEVRMGTDRSKLPGTFTFKLYEVLETGELESLYEAEYQRTDLYQGYYYPFGFVPITNAQGKTYLIELESQTHSPIFVYTNSDGELSYTVLTEGSGQELFRQIKETVSQKVQHQQTFFSFYTLLIGAILGILLVGIVQKQHD